MIALMAEFQAMDLNNSSGATVTNANAIRQLNWAQRIVAREVKDFNEKMVFTLADDTAEYDLFTCATKRIIRPYRVWISSQVLCGADRHPGLWSMGDLEAVNPNWIVDASDTPSRAIWNGGRQLFLNPPPTPAVADETDHFISGEIIPADMTEAGIASQCEANSELHEAICAVAVMLSAYPTATERIEFDRLALYDNGKYSLIIRQLARENQSRRSMFNSRLMNPTERIIQV